MQRPTADIRVPDNKVTYETRRSREAEAKPEAEKATALVQPVHRAGFGAHAEHKATDLSLAKVKGLEGLSKPAPRSFVQMSVIQRPEAFQQARSHGQSWDAVEMEDASSQQRLGGLVGLVDAELNPDPDKVQDDIN